MPTGRSAAMRVKSSSTGSNPLGVRCRPPPALLVGLCGYRSCGRGGIR